MTENSPQPEDINVMVPYKKDGGIWFTPPRRVFEGGRWVNKKSYFKKQDNLEWRKSENFNAELKLVHYQEGQEGSFYLWADTETNSTYPMTPDEMHQMLMKALVEDGFAEGEWSIVNKNGVYSIHLVQEVTE